MQGDDADLYAGFVSAVQKKKADLFALVIPPGCDRDSLGALAEAGRRYRLLTAQSARGVLGIGADAPCAVREALTTTGRRRGRRGVGPVSGADGGAGHAPRRCCSPRARARRARGPRRCG